MLFPVEKAAQKLSAAQMYLWLKYKTVLQPIIQKRWDDQQRLKGKPTGTRPTMPFCNSATRELYDVETPACKELVEKCCSDPKEAEMVGDGVDEEEYVDLNAEITDIDRKELLRESKANAMQE